MAIKTGHASLQLSSLPASVLSENQPFLIFLTALQSGIYSKTMQSSYLYLNGLRVHYLHWKGPDVSQPVVVLLHGLASNAHIWDFVAPLLAAEGYPTLAIDARSHGLTDGSDGDYSFDIFTHDLAAFLDTCDVEKPVLIGHSWGANRALDYAVRFPVGRRAPAGLVLVDGGINQMNQAIPGFPPPDWENMRERLTPPRLAGTPLESFVKHVKSFIADWGLSDEMKNQVISIVLGNFEIYMDDTQGLECIRPHLAFENHMQIVRALWEFNTFEYFGRIPCPVLLLPSRPASPRSAPDEIYLAAKEYGVKIATEMIHDLTVYWMENAVHDSPLQRPTELTSQINQFIASLHRA